MTPAPRQGEGVAEAWNDEDHDPNCESRMMGRCDCTRYILVSTARAFKRDIEAACAETKSRASQYRQTKEDPA